MTVINSIDAEPSVCYTGWCFAGRRVAGTEEDINRLEQYRGCRRRQGDTVFVLDYVWEEDDGCIGGYRPVKSPAAEYLDSIII